MSPTIQTPAAITDEVRDRLTELFVFPEQRVRDLLEVKTVAVKGIAHGRIPGVRLWYWGEDTPDGILITRVWPDNPFAQAA